MVPNVPKAGRVARRAVAGAPAYDRRMVRSSADALGDDAVVAATGQPRAYWFELLDAHDASSWSHQDIASWLVSVQGVDGWWAQSVTVAYEQARGLRAPGQRADGTFEVSASRTVPGTLDAVFAAVADEASRARWLDPALPAAGAGGRSEVLAATPGTSVRLRWPAGALGGAEADARVVVGLYQPRDDDGDPTGKVRVGVSHPGLNTPDDAAALKEFWKARLDDLARLLERPA